MDISKFAAHLLLHSEAAAFGGINYLESSIALSVSSITGGFLTIKLEKFERKKRLKHYGNV